MKEITSKDNPIVKEIGKLLSSKSRRMEQGLFVVEGLRLCMEAVDAGAVIRQAFFTHDFAHRNPQEYQIISSRSQESCFVSPGISARLSDTSSPQGVLCVCAMLDNSHYAGTICGGKYILLCSLQDPGNIGTIIRTSEALGIDGIIMSSDCPDIYSPKVLRSTMGGVFRIPIFTTSDIKADIADLQKQGFNVLAAALTPQAKDVTETCLSGNTAVVIGNEGNGLPEEVVSVCSSSVIIPMARQGQSLNAASAASILIWELYKAK